MNTKYFFSVVLIMVFFGSLTNAVASNLNSVNLNNAEYADNSIFTAQSDSVKADFDDFPNLHPLVVHFPIVLLILGVLFQFIQLFVMNRTMDWVILMTVGAGFVGAYIAGTFVHPHTEGLTEAAKQVLEEHDKYALWTLWSSAAAALLKIGSLFLFRSKKWFEIIVCIVLAFSGYAVGIAAHYGAQLVYIEGVGPQGKFMGHEDEDGQGGNESHSH